MSEGLNPREEIERELARNSDEYSALAEGLLALIRAGQEEEHIDEINERMEHLGARQHELLQLLRALDLAHEAGGKDGPVDQAG